MLEKTKAHSTEILKAAFFLAVLSLTAAATIVVFRSLPIEETTLGLDWMTIWEGISHGDVYASMGRFDSVSSRLAFLS